MFAKGLRLPIFACLVTALASMVAQAQTGDVRLAWDPPTTNADGTSLGDLAGYKIYWGKSSGSYQQTQKVDKATTSVTLTNLSEGETYYFAATALNLTGNESEYSNEVSTTIPLADTDGDGLTDRDEREIYGTAPNLADTDGDGLSDGTEVVLWEGAWADDYDNDGLINLLDPDADNDGFMDGTEYNNGFNPADPTVHPQVDDHLAWPVQAVTASTWQEPNVPANTRDENLSTRWSAAGDGQWISYDLGTPRMVSEVAIAWYQGDRRQSAFTVEVSSDGAQWTAVYSGNSSGTTLELESYSFAAVSAQYVRIVGYGNTASLWNSVTEVQIYGSKSASEVPTPEVALPVQAVTASASDGPNVAANTRDGDLSTRWSAAGDGQWIMYDLGTPRMVSEVAMAWYQGDRRQSAFTVEVSSDGTQWTAVYNGNSSGTTLELEPYGFEAVSARYVRIVGHGNTASLWNSITEVEIWGR